MRGNQIQQVCDCNHCAQCVTAKCCGECDCATGSDIGARSASPKRTFSKLFGRSDTADQRSGTIGYDESTPKGESPGREWGDSSGGAYGGVRSEYDREGPKGGRRARRADSGAGAYPRPKRRSTAGTSRAAKKPARKTTARRVSVRAKTKGSAGPKTASRKAAGRRTARKAPSKAASKRSRGR